ncbi:MAG: S49 family peptidase [Pseudomonadota bacterium]
MKRFLSRLPILKKVLHPKPIVPVLRFTGVIGEQGRFAQGLNLAAVSSSLTKAFSVADAKAVAIIINSPGGSPVQSGLIFSRIRELADEKDKQVFVFAEDVAASGGYLIACAGDEIYVHDASVVGSIGVISAGFGFVELLNKVGVERRVYTAGESKSMLDPFKPEEPEDIERLKQLQSDIHTYFKDLVRDRRGDRLKAPRKQVFSGDIWVGKKAVSAGLVDGVGTVRDVMREKFGKDVDLPLIQSKRKFRLPFMAHGPALSARTLLSELRSQADWSRFGQ